MKNSSTPRVVADRQRHTCIEIFRKDGLVHCIPLNIEGLEVVQMNEDSFNSVYKPLSDYPVVKAARLYAAYAADIGGSKEAMKALSSIHPLSSQEIEMATAKKTAAKAVEKETKATKKVAVEKPAKAAPVKVAKAAPAKVAKAAPAKVAKAAPAKKVATGEKTHSAANMFKDLIMEGKLTDDQIFAKVQKEFNLDDNKRSYVRWYRNDLTKKGMNPPEAK
jgi:hypothetical protein